MDVPLKQSGILLPFQGQAVSILVLVDFALKQKHEAPVVIGHPGFNPCFGGFCSKTVVEKKCWHPIISFNPCFDGFCSKTFSKLFSIKPGAVFQSLF